MAQTTSKVIRDFTLHLNDEEATVLVDVLSNIGGYKESRRRLTDEILRSLKGAGAVSGPENDDGLTADIDSTRRSIYFLTEGQ